MANNSKPTFFRMALFKERIAQFERKELIILTSLVLIVLGIEWFIGQQKNNNLLVLVTYAFYLWILFVRDRKFVLEFFWVITMASLNVVGAFCCDEGLYLVELEYSSWYADVVAPLVILYILFFFSVELCRLGRKEKEIPEPKKGTIDLSTVMLFVGIAVAVYLFLQVVRMPYFAVGTLRIDYASQYMAPFSVSLRTYLPMFIPFAVMEWKKDRRFFPLLFGVITAAFYFLEGDKFGVYFFAAYIIALSILPTVKEKTIKKIIIYLFLFFWALWNF